VSKREIKIQQQRNALRVAKGAWKEKDHPELAQGAAAWVRQIRAALARSVSWNWNSAVDPDR
jgi:hypothetical protein